MSAFKRAVVRSSLALSATISALAIPSALVAVEAERPVPVLIYCISCGTHHLVAIEVPD